MMHRRTRITIGVVVAVLLLLAVAIFLRVQAPPEVARLLPEADGIVYLNLRPLRAATHFQKAQVKPSPEYQRFIDGTGIVVERDLDEVAFALQRMPSADGPNGPVAYSEVFHGHFDGRRMSQYLATVADAQEQYAGHTIYDIQSEGRVDRVALLGYDMVAVSNSPTAEQIHSILDRYSTAALPFSGSSLLSAHFREVPLLSLAWGVGKIALPLKDDQQPQVKVMGLDLPISPESTFIASLRWAGTLHLRVEELAPNSSDATNTANALGTLLALARSAENAPPGDQLDASVKSFLESTKVDHEKGRVVLTASVPTSLLEKLLTPAQPTATASPMQ